MKPILFFFVKNNFCKNYFLNYVKKYHADVEMIDMSTPDGKAKGRLMNVSSVPSVLLLDETGKNESMGWRGGARPDMHRVGVELVLRREYKI